MIHEARYRERGADAMQHRKHIETECYELLLVHEGEGHMFIKDRLYPLRAGTLFFVSPGELHCSMPVVPQAYCRSKLIIEREALGTLLSVVESSFLLASVFDGENACLVPQEEGLVLIERRLETVARLYAGGRAEDKPVLYAALLSLLDLCAHSGRAPVVPRDGVAARALAYIGTHLCEPLTLDEIAAALYVSKCHLCRAFSRAVGMTVMDYIGSRRLALAKQLLVTTGKSVSEIAAAAGFSGFSYFSNYFRRAEGKTPSAYRRENQ